MEAYINAISYYLPEDVLGNDKLEELFPEWSAEKVFAKIGVSKRHIAAKTETAGDMAYKAALRLFEEYSLPPSSIDYILFCTQSPDYYLPTTACILQSKLKIPTNAGALDFNLGCSGYVYGLSLAKGLLAAGIAKNVLLLTGETYSKYINDADKGNRSIFGDAATATIISSTGFARIDEFVLGTDGRGADNLIVRNGCSKHPVSYQKDTADNGGYFNSPNHLYMNGSEIFNFTIEAVPLLLESVLKRNSKEIADIDFFIFHQANKFMLNTLRKICIIPKDKFYINMEETANTVSSTIPIAIKQVISANVLTANSNIVIAGFGVGYSWGACVLHLEKI